MSGNGAGIGTMPDIIVAVLVLIPEEWTQTPSVCCVVATVTTVQLAAVYRSVTMSARTAAATAGFVWPGLSHD